MKAVILAGGLGTRLSEETGLIPKPMVAIGDRPILWHIMKSYERFGIDEFVICLGYKGYVVKEYFANYALHAADVTIKLDDGIMNVHRRRAESWRVTLIDTGAKTMTGGRLGRVREYLDDTFLVTYGDGVSDVNIGATIDFHRAHGAMATVTGVLPPGRYGALEMENEAVKSFMEKPQGDGGVINGGYFVFEPQVLDLIESDETVLEEDVLPRLAELDELRAFKHTGFWQPMDTLRDKRQLEALYEAGNAPWAYWLTDEAR